MLYFHYNEIVVQDTSSISINHGLIRSILFNFQGFWNFPDLFLLLISNLILLLSENTP